MLEILSLVAIGLALYTLNAARNSAQKKASRKLFRLAF